MRNYQLSFYAYATAVGTGAATGARLGVAAGADDADAAGFAGVVFEAT